MLGIKPQAVGLQLDVPARSAISATDRLIGMLNSSAKTHDIEVIFKNKTRESIASLRTLLANTPRDAENTLKIESTLKLLNEDFLGAGMVCEVANVDSKDGDLGYDKINVRLWEENQRYSKGLKGFLVHAYKSDFTTGHVGWDVFPTGEESARKKMSGYEVFLRLLEARLKDQDIIKNSCFLELPAPSRESLRVSRRCCLIL